MLPPAVVEQQAKLGVSAEESKAQRLKRQQARFRDRGGAFVPSTSNPLVDILLARTVSGESPSKPRPKDAGAKRLSPSKARPRTSVVAGGSKTTRKRNANAVAPEADLVAKPTPKRRGAAKGKRKAPDPGSDAEQTIATTTKSKSTAKSKGKQRAATSTSDGEPKPKPKPKAKSTGKTKRAKKVVEVLDSDDDQTLVEVPHKAKRAIEYKDDSETDDDVPIVRKRTIRHVDDSNTSGIKTTTSVKTERTVGGGSLVKKALANGEERAQDEKRPKTSTKKWLILRDEDDDDVAPPPTKKGKTVDLTSGKSRPVIEPRPDPEPAPRPIKEIKNGQNAKVTGKGKGKGKRKINTDPDEDMVEVEEEGHDDRHPERALKPEKRKKEEDNYDDRPRKVVKFSESGAPHASSQMLKENQSDKKRERIIKSSAKDEPDVQREKLATKLPSRTKTPKGPPLEVLERIRVSAARHLQCADSEPDELDCLS